MRFFIKKAVSFHFSLYLCRRYSEEMKLLYYFIYSVLYLFSLLQQSHLLVPGEVRRRDQTDRTRVLPLVL